MANPYIRNSTLTETQVQDILRGYTRFVSPKEIAEQVGVSRQTTHSLYLKFSQRLHAGSRRDESRQDAFYQALCQWLGNTELEWEYAIYQDGPTLDSYQASREGRMLSPEEYGTYIVGRELKQRWGKVSEKAFEFHYALIKQTADCRIDWLALCRTDDLSHPTVALAAAEQIYRHLEKSLRNRPLSKRREN